MARLETKKHKHVWSTEGCKYYHIGGTRLWIFRKCIECGLMQDAPVNTDKYIKWSNWNVEEK